MSVPARSAAAARARLLEGVPVPGRGDLSADDRRAVAAGRFVWLPRAMAGAGAWSVRSVGRPSRGEEFAEVRFTEAGSLCVSLAGRGDGGSVYLWPAAEFAGSAASRAVLGAALAGADDVDAAVPAAAAPPAPVPAAAGRLGEWSPVRRGRGASAVVVGWLEVWRGPCGLAMSVPGASRWIDGPVADPALARLAG